MHEPIWKLCLTRNVIANHLPAKRASAECTPCSDHFQIIDIYFLPHPQSEKVCRTMWTTEWSSHTPTRQHSNRIILDDKTYNDIIRSNKDLVNCENELNNFLGLRPRSMMWWSPGNETLPTEHRFGAVWANPFRLFDSVYIFFFNNYLHNPNLLSTRSLYWNFPLANPPCSTLLHAASITAVSFIFVAQINKMGHEQSARNRIVNIIRQSITSWEAAIGVGARSTVVAQNASYSILPIV